MKKLSIPLIDKFSFFGAAVRQFDGVQSEASCQNQDPFPSAGKPEKPSEIKNPTDLVATL